MNFNNGVLSIQDPKGRYMGMQDIANGFLRGRNIDISTQGPKESPSAIVIEVSAEEDKYVKDGQKTCSRLKGEYERYSTPKMFSVLLDRATTSFEYDKEHQRGDTYRICQDGKKKKVTPEEFYIDTYNFSSSNEE